MLGRGEKRRTPALSRMASLVLMSLAVAACGSTSSRSSSAAPAPASTSTSTGAGSATNSQSSSSPTAAGVPGGVKFAALSPIAPGSGAGLKIGYIALDDSVPYIQTVTQGIQTAAKTAGAQIFVCDAKSSAAIAQQCARNFAVEGAQGILNFNSQAAASPQVCGAGPKVPTIAVDIPQPPCQVSFLGVSNVGAGYVDGQGGALAYKQLNGCKYDAMFIVARAGSASRFASARRA